MIVIYNSSISRFIFDILFLSFFSCEDALQTSSFLHYGLAYTICLLFKCIWGVGKHIKTLQMNVSMISGRQFWTHESLRDIENKFSCSIDLFTRANEIRQRKLTRQKLGFI